MDNVFQMSLFDGTQKFKIDKPIRLVELFGGYGSQSLALKYLGVPFEHWKLSEWTVKSIQAYKDLHFGDDNTDYSANLTDSEIIDFLDGKISSNYSEPMTREQIQRLGSKGIRQVYNNMQATRNLGSVVGIKGKDLEITDTDKYCYIMTYSFPCQDLSLAGKGLGMAKDSGTRSGLLWEVERILREIKDGKGELPQVLLMENVPEVIGAKNIKHFAEWIAFLEKLGYKTKWELLNAKGFGIPQNRNRCFAVSVLGDFYYNHPKPFPLKHRLRDVLEKKVDESYYLKDETIKALNLHKERHDALGHGFGWKPTDGGVLQQQSKPKEATDQVQTLLLSNQGKTVEKFVDVACTVMARDYKGFGNQAMTANCPTIRADRQGLKVIKPIVYDDYNSKVRADQDTIGTLTTNCGNDAPRNGWKIIEPLKNNNKRQRSLISKIDRTKDGQFLDFYNQSTNENISGTTTRVDASNSIGVFNNYRVRKLTPRECGRLMGVKNEDIDKIGKNLSKSAQHHVFGDSIVSTTLMAIFGEMLGIDYKSMVDELVEELKDK